MLQAANSDGKDIVDLSADAICQPCAPTAEDEDLSEEFDRAQSPKGLTNIKAPSAEEQARHSLTHIPYAGWCRWCAKSSMPNTPHQWLQPFPKHIPFGGDGLLFFATSQTQKTE